VTVWVILRAAGIGAFVMTFLSVVWGLTATTGIVSSRVSRATATTLHQFISTCGLFLVGVHVGGVLIDTYTPFSLSDVLIPFSSTYRPVAIAFGIVAMYVLVGVIVLSWMRRTIGTVWWRRSHLLAVPVFALALVHGLLAGTDSARPFVWWAYVASAFVVVFLLLVRAMTIGERPPARQRSRGTTERRAPVPTRPDRARANA
jgi:sulfoxide reductase heme-binding subunit YedZ